MFSVLCFLDGSILYIVLIMGFLPSGGCIHMNVRAEKQHFSGLTWNFCIQKNMVKSTLSKKDISRSNVELLYS